MESQTPFPDRELRRIASFHLWEAAKRVAAVAGRASNPGFQAELDAVVAWLQREHERLDAPHAGAEVIRSGD